MVPSPVTDPEALMSSELRDRVLAWLRQQVPESRLQHILRVEHYSVELAERHDLDRPKAAMAGLMHDLAKNFPPQRLLDMARDRGVETDAVLANNPHLLHADVSAIVAREAFAIADGEILEAIANHTLGRPGMSPLSCVVFLADSLEPGRGETAELETLRRASAENLHRAVWLTSDYTLRYLMDSQRPIHPRAVTTRNWALSEARSPSR